MILESIVTTTNLNGEAHMAAFGLRETPDGKFIIAPFKPSTSLENMLRTKSAVVSWTDDVRAFAGVITGRKLHPMNKASVVQGWVLNSALSHVELSLVSVVDHADRPELTFEVVHSKTHAPFKGFNRAQGAVLEAAVLASRLHMLPAEKIKAELAYLSIAIDKTAGWREREAWGWLMAKIDAHFGAQTPALLLKSAP